MNPEIGSHRSGDRLTIQQFREALQRCGSTDEVQRLHHAHFGQVDGSMSELLQLLIAIDGRRIEISCREMFGGQPFPMEVLG